ncbi:tripartite tricarboxylate transporter substrate binding protein [Roseomonas sp. NAR14]|uniref:Tripartite tricarboxylate transporter substrate binding protein n=1 Tax=Roseomonas acroporae TaxID=2937791 RepID=A0A9X2BV43_9PROT|nr:tripartite tricarboxylate transporter substrate binding protein [Roseomonas acroporae]MCK8786268.1 tripartite tricarboxylate transporter substrate binding protein [Roseomonas acroporae]
MPMTAAADARPSTHPGRRTLLLGAAAGLAAPGLRAARAADWPDRPVRLIVPFTPGGSTDILARALAQQLSESLGQQFIVENRSGAGGTVGTEVVARAAPDGNTLLMGHIGTLAVNPALYPGLSFDTVTSFQPVILMAVVPNVLVVNPRKVEANDVPGLVALAKRNPGAFTYGSGGNGSAAHIAMVAFAAATGISLTHIPYRGTGPMMTDLIAGQIDLTMTGGPPALPAVRAGQVRALGVSGLSRLAAEPAIPTIAEQGVPGFEAVQWYGVVAPAGTPRAIVDRLNAECTRILHGQALKARLAAEGAEAAPGTPEAFGAFIRTERERWGALIRSANVRPD